MRRCVRNTASNAVSGGLAIGTLAAGGAIGAALGSVVPGAGTIIGAILGFVGALVLGYYGRKKTRQYFDAWWPPDVCTRALILIT